MACRPPILRLTLLLPSCSGPTTHPTSPDPDHVSRTLTLTPTPIVTLDHRHPQNAVPLISDKNYLRGGSGITALEAYHAGAIRTLLLQQADTIVQPWGVSVAAVTKVRINLRQ